MSHGRLQQNSANPYQAPGAEASTKTGDSNRVSIANRIFSNVLGVCCMAASVIFSVPAVLAFLENAPVSRLQSALGIVLLMCVVLNALGVYFAIRHRPMFTLCLFLSSLGLFAAINVVLAPVIR